MADLADVQWKVYSEVVTHQLHVMAQARESSPVINRRSDHCATPPNKGLGLGLRLGLGLVLDATSVCLISTLYLLLARSYT